MSTYVLLNGAAANGAGNTKKRAVNDSLETPLLLKTDSWSVSGELIRRWRWRCLDEDVLVTGIDLCLLDPGSGLLLSLGETHACCVARHSLRHSCGGLVIPVAPLTTA